MQQKITLFLVLLSFCALEIKAQTITTICGGATGGYSGDNGPATAAEISADVSQLAVDANGNIYIADYANNRIRKINISTGTITTVAGNGNAGSSGDGGLATAAELNQPYGVAVDLAGNIYISEYAGFRIRMVNTGGTITTICGDGTSSSTGDGGLATAATVNGTGFIAVDAAGNIYFTEYSGHRIRKIASTGTISTICGDGTGSNTGDGGPAILATCNQPWALTCDPSGNVYFASYSTNFNGAVLRKIATTGTVTAFAGTGTSGFSGDGGLATAAEVEDVQGIAINKKGEVIFTDRSNERVRSVDVNGTITTIAGTGNSGYSGDNGLSAAAELEGTSGIVHFGCNYYFLDQYGAAIRRVNGPLPNVTAITSNSIICGPPFQGTATLTAGGANTYTWSTSSNSSTIAVSPSVTTSYTVTGTDANGCTNTATITQTVSICADINNSTFNTQYSTFLVYPNPNNGIFTIELPVDAKLEIINALGQTVFNENKLYGNYAIDLSSYQNGIYIIKLSSHQGKAVYRIIKN